MAKGIILMAHGVARDIGDIPRYYAHIRGSRPTNPAVEAELVQRYRAIGGHSPLIEITRSLASGLESVLKRRHGAAAARVDYGFRHCEPYIADAMKELSTDPDVAELTGLILAPHYSDMSVGAYIRAGEAAELQRPLVRRYILSWHTEPSLIRLLAARVVEAQASLGPLGREAVVLFTAHSLPERIVGAGDPYPAQVHETGELVAKSLSLPRYGFAWQSAGRTADPWLGPDVLERIRELKADGAASVVVCPCGFVSDHLEVLYDLDQEARTVARDAGIAFARTRSLNDDPAFAEVLADVLDHEEGRLASETRVGGHLA